MKNQPGTMKNHEKRPETMKNQPGRNKQKRHKQTDRQNLPIIYRFRNPYTVSAMMLFKFNQGFMLWREAILITSYEEIENYC